MGASRELTLSFYFTIDDFGSKNDAEKQFGFLMGSYRIYFMPEKDGAGIDQFRHIYKQVGTDEPECLPLLNFTFLEGERIRCVINISQDGISYIHLCKLGAHADDVFILPLTLTLAGFC